jgi:YHS domain-containing protein
VVRYILLLVLIVLVARAFWRIVDGVAEGLRGSSGPSRPPARSVAMQRDPVCGTFVVPERAVTLSVGGDLVYFCSATCRDKYRARPSRGSRAESAGGRIA